ncbi:uncharacterized protein E0L32_001009 [Thyridium curvatum]|uniref:NF-kappa-B inhibitor-like protein 1 n=1 Tax=Thyridium curvatum TaxID=1093900 RepID=A0A507B293_9PEZI|nr:uncharacterized protein E0L32_001009 [Thyridium curvatum]TPX11191.1 hypothetical protein E0L32_001009 [Thyridium curvatum]
MTEESRAPKRVHILSSINPPEHLHDEPHDKSRNDDAPDSTSPQDDKTEENVTEKDSQKPQTSRFRFKSKDSRSRHRSDRHRDGDEQGRSHRRHRSRSRSPSRDRDDGSSSRHHRHHHRRHKRRRRRRSGSPPREDEKRETEPDDPYAPPPLSPDAAFREALFDAMADDEGASYWEGVYGQPLHVYGDPGRPNAQTGELERMTEEEYAAYVRQRMWEKTHAGLLEERERRAREREERAAREDEERRVTAEMERSLRRGEERRRKKAWAARWEQYVRAWDGWDGGSVDGIPWPVESGRRGDTEDAEAVRQFFVLGLNLEALGEKAFAARLKDERVRWHPDKMQQRLGGREKADPALMKDVTAIFQIIDKLWADVRARGSA